MKRPTKTEPFVQHRLALLESPAWRCLSRDAHLLLARIEIEHMRHAGQDNGHLVVTYEDFTKYTGGHRRAIAQAIDDAEVLGLLETSRGRAGNGDFRAPNRFRLTYLPANRCGPTDEWLQVETLDDANARLKPVKRSRKPTSWLLSKGDKVVQFSAKAVAK
jgi:hypothetical protein